MRRLSGITQVVLVTCALGAGWLVWDVASNNQPGGGDRFEQIDAYVSDQMEGARIPGVSLAIVEDGVITHSAGFGNDGHGAPITSETPFWIGSNTKSVTALAVMQLVEAGLVELDAPVEDYLPSFGVADDEASAQITVRHLLNQTSGISRTDGLRAVVNADEADSIDTVVAGMADLELNRPVGETFEYANLNSVVLGAIIEQVTGQSWQEYVQAEIFDPLEMTSTFTDQAAAESAGLTATHRSFLGFPVETDGEHLPGLASSGYVYSSAGDMARYLAMYSNAGRLDGARVLSAAGIDQMLSPATPERTFTLQSQQFTAQYGAGWFVGPFGAADDARWHQGSLPHFATWMVLLPDSDQAVIVMINSGSQFEIAGANATWSRIPQGVVNILRDSQAPTGTDPTRFYIVFSTVVALIVALQVWTLARVLRRPRADMRPTFRRRAPLLGELVVAPLVLLAYPAVTGGLGYPAALEFLPDLTLTVLIVAGLEILIGITRAVRLVRSRDSARTPPEKVPAGIR